MLPSLFLTGSPDLELSLPLSLTQRDPRIIQRTLISMLSLVSLSTMSTPLTTLSNLYRSKTSIYLSYLPPHSHCPLPFYSRDPPLPSSLPRPSPLSLSHFSLPASPPHPPLSPSISTTHSLFLTNSLHHLLSLHPLSIYLQI